MNKSTVGAIVRKWKTYKTIDNLPRSRAPRKISFHWVKLIVRALSKNPRTKRRDLMNDLQRAGTKLTHYAERDFLQCQTCPPACPVRLKFSRERMDDPEEDWENIMSSDV